jgi:hypothetical protein
MNVREWRETQRRKAAEEAVELTLPSGLTVLARRPDPAAVLTWGRLPLGLAAELMEKGEQTPMARPQILENIEVVRQLLLYCLVRPRISLDPRGDDEIHPREIPMEDVAFVTRWAMRGEEADQVRPFRAQRADDRPGRDGEDLRDAALGTAGDGRPTAGAGAGPGGGAGADAAGAGRVHFIG